jgi:conjugative relaxase-like TrwC/TraI family protein
MMTLSKASASHAAHYYTEDLPGQNTSDSCWLGKGTVELKLEGVVKPDDFEALLHGNSPTGEPLSQKKRTGTVAAYDLTFSAEKSASVAAVVYESSIVLAAHRWAVTETVRAIEKEVQAREMIGGLVHFTETKNITAATFEHKLSRENDPQLHTHVIVINATKHKGLWRSLYARRIFQKIKEWGQFYRDKMNEALVRAGHELRKAASGVKAISSIPEYVMEYFSKRRKQIIERVGEGATTKQKQYACLSTRKAKQTRPLEALRQQWKSEIAKLKLSRKVRLPIGGLDKEERDR